MVENLNFWVASQPQNFKTKTFVEKIVKMGDDRNLARKRSKSPRRRSRTPPLRKRSRSPKGSRRRSRSRDRGDHKRDRRHRSPSSKVRISVFSWFTFQNFHCGAFLTSLIRMSYRNLVKILSKFSQNAVKMQSKCSKDSVKM